MGLGTIIESIGEKIKNLLPAFDGLSSVREKIKTNTKVVMIAVAALMVIIALLLVLAVVSHTKRETTGESQYEFSNDQILREKLPADEFFLPYEPDFVPDVLLEREPKESWAEEDVRSFWTDPLEGNEGTWRKRIESGIDALLENVP